MKRPVPTRKSSPRDRESGQAMVEFALVLFPLLTVVAGIIYFGIGLNYWLDMNRVANQGARFAAVNNWPPQCRRPTTAQPSTYCDDVETSCSAALAANSNTRLQDVLRCSARNNPTVNICYPNNANPATVAAGDPVQVKLTAPYRFFFIDSFQINLRASATIRLEQRPTYITGALGGTCP